MNKEPLFPFIGLKQTLTEEQRNEQLLMNSSYAKGKVDKKTYRDWIKDFESKTDENTYA